MMTTKIPVGISGCVLGNKVRFDGGHKSNRFILDTLSEFFDFHPVCPEVEVGMGVPRPVIRLIELEGRTALVQSKNESVNYTDTMYRYAENKINTMQPKKLCGYVVASKSPTCGMQGVKVYQQGGVRKDGTGLYTAKLIEKMPWLPVEEDGRLNDPVLRENFIARVFCLYDLYQSVSDVPSPAEIIAFHSRYKFTLMAHDPLSYRALGQMVANIKDTDINEFFVQYRLGLMNALTKRASRKNATNVLMHIQGYFKPFLNPVQKKELTRLIHDYRQGVLPLLVPVTMIQHYLSQYPNAYIAQQQYLNPYPQGLKLRYGL
ncbi:YbgA family protein [Vibrio quintilis]|uniref:YbgA family protein n=1 Tax=Vibrio quintilis TaxID=1117707 RepID=UPI0009359278|nr:DUF523 and DUF1722 domain-containing protein [Vibrio quintilis]